MGCPEQTSEMLVCFFDFGNPCLKNGIIIKEGRDCRETNKI